MKINTNNGIYIQKKDIELIIKITDEKEVPKNIIEIYKENMNLNELDFMCFNNKDDIDFFNSFWFIIDYIDFKDFTSFEINQHRRNDLNTLSDMQRTYNSHYMFNNTKTYTNVIDMFLETTVFRMPNMVEAKKYPLDFQLLHNKLLDFDIIKRLQDGEIKLNLPEDVPKPIYYSKKQLQKIYSEVLSNTLSFEELKPFKNQLYSIFSRINYSPEIIIIIRKIFNINEYNTIEFIQDDLLDLLLYLNGKKSKFEEHTSSLIDYLYCIGYNNFEDFDSKIILEMDLKRIKHTIYYIMWNNPDEYFITELSKYNYMLAEIIRTLKNVNFSYKSKNTILLNDIFLNMIVFAYFKPEIINNDLDFMKEVYEYLKNNLGHIIQFIGYTDETFDDLENNFIKYFNSANKLLIDLYNKRHNNSMVKKLNSPKNS